MPAIKDKVARETIAPLVIDELSEVTDHDEIAEDQRLFEDLGMGATIRSGMAPRYTRISKRFGGKSMFPRLKFSPNTLHPAGPRHQLLSVCGTSK